MSALDFDSTSMKEKEWRLLPEIHSPTIQMSDLPSYTAATEPSYNQLRLLEEISQRPHVSMYQINADQDSVSYYHYRRSFINSICKKLLYVCGTYKHFIVATVITTLICTMIYLWFSKLHQQGSAADDIDMQQNPATDDTGQSIHVPKESTLRVKIGEIEKLASAGSWVRAIVIEADNQHGSASGYGTSQFDRLRPNARIQTLEIESRISWPMLQALIEAMPRLKHLSVNLISSCGQALLTNGQDTFHETDFESPIIDKDLQIETVTLSNAIENCSILEMILRTKIPHLKRLTILESRFDSEACPTLEAFLRDMSQSLNEIIIEETYLSDCDFREIHFPQMYNMIAREPDPGTDLEEEIN